jgi:hypothetical protein
MSDPATFKCDGCGKSYKWKPELAGRKAKCKCGYEMTVPASLETKSDDDDGLYDLAPVEEKPRPVKTAATAGSASPALAGVGGAAAPRPKVVLASAQGGAAAAGAAAVPSARPAPVLPYGGGMRRRGNDEDEFENSLGGSVVTEIYLPIALIFVGVLLQAWLAMEESGLTLMQSLPAIGIRLIGGLILCFAAVAIVAKLFEISFGAPGPAVLKMSACILLPPAISGLIGHVIGADSGFVRLMVSSVLFFPITWIMLWKLFNMDWDEAIWVETAIWLIQQWVMIFLLTVLLGGGGGFAFGGGGGGGGGTPTVDAQVKQMLTGPGVQNGNDWLGQSPTRQIGMLGNDGSKKLVQELYDMGAKEVTVLARKGNPNVSTVIVELPRGRDEIEKISLWAEDLEEKNAEAEIGNRYMVIEFSTFNPDFMD